MSRNLLFLLLSLTLVSCWTKNRYKERPLHKVWGYKPVYAADTAAALQIVFDTARPIKIPGKIYALGNLIFQNDLGSGIHILDRTNPAQIKSKGFIRVRGNLEMSIKGNFMYVNSYNDLVVVDVSDWQKPREVKRIKNAFQHGLSSPGFYAFIPLPEHNVYYDCTNYQIGGLQTGWVRDSIYDQCLYP